MITFEKGTSTADVFGYDFDVPLRGISHLSEGEKQEIEMRKLRAFKRDARDCRDEIE